jgi:hypothetical protein
MFLLLVLGLSLAALGSRFFRLGAWPFFGDEMATFLEADSLFRGETGRFDEQIDKLPRMIPLGHAIHYAGYQLFGRDEFGSRVSVALLGAALVVLPFVCLDGPFSRVTALAAALLVLASPEHVFRSQENRFYTPAALFTGLCMLLGARAVNRGSTRLTALAAFAALAALLTHTLQGLALPGLFAATLLADRAARRRLAWARLAVVAAAGLAGSIFALWYLLPLARGWNAGQGWGTGSLSGLLMSVTQVGWPVVLLAGVGGLGVWRRQNEQGWYWLTWAALWAAASVILPRFVVYHAAYVFPLALGVIVLAGLGVGTIFDALRERSPAMAGGWLAAAACFNVPGLLSHYSDGTRWDYRTPAAHIARRWQPGDRVAAMCASTLQHYLGARDAGQPAPPWVARLPVWDPLRDLTKLAPRDDRLWIVLTSERTGLDPGLRQWLGRYCTEELEVRRARYDHRQHVVEVFLYDPSRGGDLLAQTPVGTESPDNFGIRHTRSVGPVAETSGP